VSILLDLSELPDQKMRKRVRHSLCVFIWALWGAYKCIERIWALVHCVLLNSVLAVVLFLSKQRIVKGDQSCS